MKIFISMCMSGKTEEQIHTDFIYEKNRIVNLIRNYKIEYNSGIFEFIENSGIDPEYEFIEFIDSFISDEIKEKNIGVAYLGKSIEFMADADLCVFVNGWKSGKGCRVEHLVAKNYNIPIAYI